MRRLLPLFLLAAFVLPTPSASAAGKTRVTDLTRLYAMAVTGDHIYLSPGVSGSVIAIMNPDGTQAGSITNVPGASGMVVVGDILYVAAFGASSIDRFDLSTDPPTPLTSFSTYPLSSPRDLAFQGNRLWFTSLCDQWGSRVARMPLDGSPVKELKGSNGDWNYCTAMESSPFAPDRIFLHSEGVSPQHLYEYDVTPGQRTSLVTSDPWSWGSYGGAPVEPIPGGTEFALAWTGGIGTFRMTDMFGPTGTYTGGGGTALVATDQNGGLLAAGTGGPYATEVTVWKIGQFEPLRSVDFTTGATELWSDGLGFSPDGLRLYAVTGAYSNRVLFRVIRLGAQT